MKNWFLWLVIAIVSIGSGLVSLFNPFAASLAAGQLAGGFFLIIGASQIYASWRSVQFRSKIWALIGGVTALLIGASILYNPFDGLRSLTILIAILFLIIGSAKIFISLGYRGTKYFIPILISGIVSFGLAILILINFLSTTESILGIFLAVELISNGLFLAILALNRKAAPAKI